MTGFYHFVAGVTAEQVAVEGLAALPEDLQAVLADVRGFPQDATVSGVERGPGDKSGVVIYPKSPAAGDELPDVLQYRPDVQTWLAVGKHPQRWIGWLHDEPPTPDDLRRRQIYPGYTIADEHGHDWSVPIARSPHAELGSLPSNLVMGDDGWEQQLKPAYQWVWDLSGEIWDWWNAPDGEKPPQCTSEWLIDAAVKILGINYRVAAWELTALGRAGRNVLDQTLVTRVLVAAIDYDIVEEHTKKKSATSSPSAAASCSSTTGGADGSPATE